MSHRFMIQWRSSLRHLARTPLSTVTSIGTLGLTIAGATALFCIYYGVVLRPAPYRDPDSLVWIEGINDSALPRQRRAALREQLLTTAVFSERSRAARQSLFEVGSEATESWGIAARGVSESFFSLVGVRPLLGAPLSASDPQDGGVRSVVVGYTLWQRRFGGRNDVIGSIVAIPGSLDGLRWRIVGVMPRGFDFPDGANLWTWLDDGPPELARLAPQVTLEQARNVLNGLRLTPLSEHLRSTDSAVIRLMVLVGWIVLILALLEATAVLATRSALRVRETGIRMALGASRSWLVTQVVLEAVGVAGAATILGTLLAPALVGAVVALMPPAALAGRSLTISPATLIYAGVLGAISAVALSLGPMAVVRRTTPSVLLRAPKVPAQSTATRVTLTLQIATSVAVVYLTGGVLGTFARTAMRPTGVAAEDLLAVRFPALSVSAREPAESRARAIADAQDARLETVARIAAMPDVSGVSTVSRYPFDPYPQADVPVSLGADSIGVARVNHVTPGFFEAIGPPLLAGTDRVAPVDVPASGIEACVINAALAALIDVQPSPVGSLLRAGSRDVRVIGIAPSIRDVRPALPADPELFCIGSIMQTPVAIVRVRSSREPVESGLRSIFQDVFGDRGGQAIVRISDARATAMSGEYSTLVLFGTLAALCLAFATIGTSAAVTDTLNRRRRDMAIRIALGAGRPLALLAACRGLLRSAAAGTLIGLAVGVASLRSLTTLAASSAAFDPWAWASVAVLLAIASAAAALWPIRYALGVAPHRMLARIE